MDMLRPWIKRLTPIRFFLGFAAVVLVLGASLIRFDVSDLVLLIMVLPILLAAHLGQRRLYLPALTILTLLSIWVIVSTSSDLPKSFSVLALIFVSVFAAAEAIYRLSRIQRRQLGTLHARDRWFRSIFADSPIAIELFDGSGRLIDVNRAGMAIFGVNDIQTVKGFQIFDDPNVTDEVKERLRRGETVHYVNRFDFAPIKAANLYETSREGVIELDVLITPLGVQPEGAPEGYLVMAQDITEQNRRQRALTASEAKLRAIFDASDDGIVLTDEAGMVIEFSQGMERITGWSRAEMLGKPVWEMEYRILPEEVRESLSQEDIRDFTQTSLRTGQASVMGAAIEKHIVGRNGVQKVVELQTFAIPSDDGFQLGSICHDMSERESAAAALRESEARYRILAEMSSDSFTILRVDEDGAMHTVWRTTEALTRLTGYSPEELAPDGYRMQGIVVPEDRGKAVFDHTPERGSLHQEFRIQRKDGQIRWLRQRYRFEHDDAGRPTMLYLAAEDITEQKRVEQEALAFHLEKEQVRLLTQFVQNASHEFRTPLSVLNLDLHYFHRVLANQDQQSRLARMDTQVKTISGLVDALLTLSTLDSEVGLELAPVDLNLLLPDLAAQSQFEAHEADVTLSLDLSPNLPQILGDPRYLATAIHNLLGNAVRYTPQGGRITLSAEDTGDTVRVVVEDTGMGIAPEILPRIFERFYRVDEAHSTQGFGLGLSIAQKVAERHSGRIHVESEIGKGSVFVLELPVMADE